MLQVISAARPGRIGQLPRLPRLRRLLVVGVGTVVAVPAIAATSAAADADDHLTVTVRHAGSGLDGTYELDCDARRGSHPDVDAACAALQRGTRWGRDTFEPVPPDSLCTMQYGGPATARVTGTWAGRPVDATYDRGDGCEIARWDRLVPLLPDLRARQQA